jgi:cobalt-zinc-cadmium efflux system membrane fusion protein
MSAMAEWHRSNKQQADTTEQTMAATSSGSHRPHAAGWLIVLGLVLGAAAGGGGVWLASQRGVQTKSETVVSRADAGSGEMETDGDGHLTDLVFPEASWAAASLVIEPATVGLVEEMTSVTGKITLNEDRLAHIFPLVEGRVDEVNVGLGDTVTQGQQMAVIQSREVGDAMLALAQDRQQLGFLKQQDAWTQEITQNTLAMIGLLRTDPSVDEIEKQLANQTLGDYREKLMTAYIERSTAKKDLERLQPLRSQGIVASRQIYEAQAKWDASRATLQSLLEQLEQDARQSAVRSTQKVTELATRVAVDEAALKILGFDADEIASIDPTQGAALARCSIDAPFSGTVISKDVTLMEHVGPANQILGVADLSTVWLSADIYEEQLPLVIGLHDRPVRFRTPAWPGESFEGTVFYAGDMVDRETRTVDMRVIADNPARKLKPGMFVTIDLPDMAAATVLQVPAAAVLDHVGQSFVFVHLGDERFARRDVVIGRQGGSSIEVLKGLEAGDPVVVSGGFALKSRMLSALLEGGEE